MAASVITDAMRGIVGGEISRKVSFPVSESDIRRWAIASYYPEAPPRRFWDAEAAAASPFGGIVAPEDFNPFAWMTVPLARKAPAGRGWSRGPEQVFGIEPPATTSMINGGRVVRYGALMRPGDVLTSVTRLGGYSERAGRLGLMLFTILADTWTNQRGELVKTDEMTMIRY